MNKTHCPQWRGKMSEAKELGIPFSADMALAVRRKVNPKTQTRRVITMPKGVEPSGGIDRVVFENGQWWVYAGDWEQDPAFTVKPPYGDVGQRLYVREPLHMVTEFGLFLISYADDDLVTVDGEHPWWNWKVKSLAGRYCPKWASRTKLEVTGLRAHLLSDMSAHEWGELDAMAEGFPVGCEPLWESATDWYISLWNKINKERGYGWDTDPWVWAYEFKRITAAEIDPAASE
jgi:hypothetical protein